MICLYIYITEADNDGDERKGNKINHLDHTHTNITNES